MYQLETAREFQKNIYFCFIDYATAFVWITTNWILKAMGIPDHLTCLLGNLYAGQEATVKTIQGTMDWFQIGKGVHQSCILSPCLFNLYAESIMWNARPDEAQAGIKIAGRNINNLRYAYDTTFLAESEEEIKSLLMKVKEEIEKADLKLSIQKKYIYQDICSYPFMVNGWGKNGNNDRLYFLSLQNYWGCWLQPRNLKDVCCLEEKQWQT